MRVWVDLTNSPHVLVLRPVIERLRAAGHEVEVTARDYAQTLELCRRYGIEHVAVGRHRGGRLAAKPDPNGLRRILAAAGVAPDRAVMIGDSAGDLECAGAAGVPGIDVEEIGVRWEPPA